VLKEDSRARDILLAMHWSSTGWRSPQLQPSTDDYDHALRSGYLFQPVEIGHDDLIQRVKDLSASVELIEARDAFLASLLSRRLYLRPFLASVVVARSMPPHSFESGRHSGPCRICGRYERTAIEDLNVLNFERHKWGGVRHLDPVFIWFCLDRLIAEGGAEASNADRGALNTLLDGLRALPPGATSTKAETALRFLPSSKAERLSLIEQLSDLSVLEDPGHHGFLRSFVAFDDRVLPDLRFMDRGYPALWWTSDHGVNADAVEALFDFS
jgi:hypothetical protein